MRPIDGESGPSIAETATHKTALTTRIKSPPIVVGSTSTWPIERLRS